ncbi:MAG: hypothetical protein JSV41_04425, partial [Gemmatimonadota bacterium]
MSKLASIRLALLAGLAWLGVAVGCSSQPETRVAELVFHNARILTMAEESPEASALAIRGDKILAVGSLEELDHLIDR